MFKKMLSIAVCTVFTLSVFAQTQKGKLLLGSNFQLVGSSSLNIGVSSSTGFSFGSIKTTSTTGGNSSTSKLDIRAFNLEPNVGYFITNGLALGAGVRYSFFGATDGDGESEIKTSSFSFAPFARYYFKGNAKVQPYAEVRGGVMREKLTLSSDGDEDENVDTPAFWGGRAGVSFFFNQNVALDLFGAFEQLRQTDDSEFLGVTTTDKTISNSFGLGLGLSIFLK